MTTCTRCAVSDWHPEARRCQLVDCELRQPHELRGFASPEAGRVCKARPAPLLTCPGGVPPFVTGDIVGAAHNDTRAEMVA